MKMHVVVQGFPGRSVNGSLSWSSVAYIETGKHKILFDTGGPSKRSSLKKRLADIAVDPESITMLVFSHFHDDHIRNYDYFPNAEILFHAVEEDWARELPISDFAFPEAYYPIIHKTGRVSLVSRDEEIAPGVNAMLVPGHTPGSMALILRDPAMPVTALTGDAVKNMAELATGAVSHSKNAAISAASIRKVRDAADVVLPGHDRLLKVEKDRIVALTEARDGVIVPPDVMEPGKEVLLDLVVPITAMPITPCTAN
ncbi:MAG: MBL fold metallo-hydrolase [Deltaproteobacteria bacterium]|jgi:glyoxylase-like metal-dependent hydrolase (beta-lactamase superfamily II)|nr:MBL fold metallo-hydrolase [Deltaproteobacteria bacterium]